MHSQPPASMSGGSVKSSSSQATVASPSRTRRRPILPVTGSMTGKASMFSIREPNTWLNEAMAQESPSCSTARS